MLQAIDAEVRINRLLTPAEIIEAERKMTELLGGNSSSYVELKPARGTEYWLIIRLKQSKIYTTN